MSIFDSTTPATEPAGSPPPTGAGTATAGVADVVVTPPVDTTTSVSDGTTVESVQTPEPKYLSTDDYGDYLVKIKVDGVDKDVPFSQVRDGLMMQDAFTKRTQELASERRALHQANALMASLEADGPGTIRQLAEAYDLDPNGLVPVQREPEEQRLVEMRRSLARQNEQLSQQRIQNEIQSLTQQFGEFDVPSVAAFAYQNGLTMDMAYRAMNFDQLRQQQSNAQQQQVTRQQAIDAQVVHSGATTQRGTVGTPPAKIDSIQDAWALTRQQLNL